MTAKLATNSIKLTVMRCIIVLLSLVLTAFSSALPSNTSYNDSELLCRAITNKRIIKFFYQDKYSNKAGWRLVEPHLIGIHKSTGSKILVAWEINESNNDKSGRALMWKSYIINRIEHLEITNRTFSQTRPYYNSKDKRMKSIICIIQND
ncbi:MAG TPA: hypothetical protein DIW54_13030 [Chitinophagaceae bacterium]|nr:hypothetical protein [Chitinophagaceae bacterium]